MLDQPGSAVLNDVNPRFTKIWNWVKSATPQQIQAMQARPWTASRESWLHARNNFKPKTLDDEVWQHLYVTRHSFMNRGDTWKGNVADPNARKNSPPTWLNRVDQYKQQLASTRIEQKDWKQILQQYDAPGTFFYLDPPYEEKFIPNLLKLLPGLKGKWLLSFSDNPTLMQGLKKAGAHVFTVPVTNTINKPTGQQRTMRKELLASNYPIQVPKGLIFKGWKGLDDFL